MYTKNISRSLLRLSAEHYICDEITGAIARKLSAYGPSPCPDYPSDHVSDLEFPDPAHLDQ